MSPLGIFVIASIILAAMQATAKAITYAIAALLVAGAIFRPRETFLLVLNWQLNTVVAGRPWLYLPLLALAAVVNGRPWATELTPQSPDTLSATH